MRLYQSAKRIIAALGAAAALCASPLTAAAQVPWLFGRDAQSDAQTPVLDSLYLSLQSHFFFKNNEYFAPYEEGYTLVGYTLRPLVNVNVGERITLMGGAHTLAYGGQDRFRHVWPYFAARLRFNEALTLQMGSLPGPESHRLHDALLNIEDQYTERPEMGFQFSARTRAFTGHGWMNWRQFIFLGDTIPEKFTAGITGTFRLAEWGGGSLTMPAAVVFDHVGGQISNFPEAMQSLSNAQLSPTLTLRPAAADTAARFVRSVSLAAHLLGFHTMAGSDVRRVADGWAFNPEVCLTARVLQASVGWWRAHNFWSPHGNPLLMSLSNYDPAVLSHNRSVVTGMAALCIGGSLVDRFSLEARAFYDTFDKRFDYAYGMAIVINVDRVNLWARKK